DALSNALSDALSNALSDALSDALSALDQIEFLREGEQHYSIMQSDALS
ncbi:hypothetical protein ACHAXA_011567, partial [Cyclostephanos tholiformis]